MEYKSRYCRPQLAPDTHREFTCSDHCVVRGNPTRQLLQTKVPRGGKKRTLIKDVDLVANFSIAAALQQVRATQAVEARTLDSAAQHLSKAIDECGWPADLMRDYVHTQALAAKGPLSKHTAVTLDLLEKHRRLARKRLGHRQLCRCRLSGAA